MTIKSRLARLEATRKTKAGNRILFASDFPTADALAAEVAHLEAEGVRTWVVHFVEPVITVEHG
jgi:hypothetical protein